MNIKTMFWYHFNVARMIKFRKKFLRGHRQGEVHQLLVKNINEHSQYVKYLMWKFFKELKTELPYI